MGFIIFTKKSFIPYYIEYVIIMILIIFINKTIIILIIIMWVHKYFIIILFGGEKNYISLYFEYFIRLYNSIIDMRIK